MPSSRAQQTVSRRKQAYRQTFSGEMAREVLEDLARFCRAHESTFLPDARAAATLDGRREVWLRIQRHLELSDDQLWALYPGVKALTGGQDG